MLASPGTSAKRSKTGSPRLFLLRFGFCSRMAFPHRSCVGHVPSKMINPTSAHQTFLTMPEQHLRSSVNTNNPIAGFSFYCRQPRVPAHLSRKIAKIDSCLRACPAAVLRLIASTLRFEHISKIDRVPLCKGINRTTLSCARQDVP